MNTELSPVEILTKTKEVLKTRGWFQGNLVEPGTNGNGRVCLLGAMNLVMRNNPRDCGSYLHNEYIINKTIKNLTCQDIVAWNDHPTRTIAQVNQTLDQAIKRLK